MLNVLQKVTNPSVLVITPLRVNDEIMPCLFETIKLNDVPFDWVSFASSANSAKNTQLGLDAYQAEFNTLPEFVIKLDNDLELRKNYLDRLTNNLLAKRRGSKMFAYSYSSFQFKGSVNLKFKCIPFDKQALLKSNYISACSLIHTSTLMNLGGFVTDERYVRLLDWALWLKMLSHGFVGSSVPTAGFIAYSSPNSVSAGSALDYAKKRALIQQDFIVPILSGQKIV